MSKRAISPPYSELAKSLLSMFFKALAELSENPTTPEQTLDEKFFKKIIRTKESNPYLGINPHITQRLIDKKSASRLSKLTASAFNEAVDAELSGMPTTAGRSIKGAFLPSPFQLLCDALTVPEEGQSRAYALVTCRTLLAGHLRVKPEEGGTSSESWCQFTPSDVLDAIADFRTYTSHRDNIPYPPKSGSRRHQFNPAKLYVAHFLAMKGIFRLRFGVGRGKEVLADKIHARTKYCKSGSIDPGIAYEFRLYGKYTDIPNASEVINEIWGIPIPLRGFETVFHGGLKPSADGNLVMAVSGKAGTGKTSLVLALAAALAPLGTICYFLSIEEKKSDLRFRLQTLVPSYLKKLSIYNPDTKDWFYVEEFTSRERSIEDLRSQLLLPLQSAVASAIKESNISVGMRAPCPLLVVVDGVSGLYADPATGDEEVQRLIKTCATLGAVVVLISGEDCPFLTRLDYLVEVFISLRHRFNDSIADKPFRVLQLMKSRLQLSRAGEHLFHLSGEDSFRISPQLPSQIDRRQTLIHQLPDRKLIINTLNEDGAFVDLYHGSQILLHGHGSSGKAGLALKILLTRPEAAPKLQVRIDEKRAAQISPRRRILVVSFLYSYKYYEELLDSLGPKSAKVEYVIFYPGFLRPEDLLNRIARKIEGGVLEGEPYTGILLDGLHNAFLQFPEIAKNGMIWPSVYGFLATHRITTVITFTTFQIEGLQAAPEASEDMHIRGHLPFLHTLVQAADFYLLVEPGKVPNRPDLSKVTAKGTIGPTRRIKRQSHVWWDRDKLVLHGERYAEATLGNADTKP